MAQQSYYDSDTQTYQIQINWIRHGESCANFDVGSNKDKKSDPSTKSGYGIVGNQYEIDRQNEQQKPVIVNVAGQIAYQEDIEIKHEDIEDIAIEHEDIEEHTQKGFIQRFLSRIRASFIYEPNLSYIGMNHAINLGTNFFSTCNHRDPRNIYISSGLTRTITTALLALRFIPDAVIYVVPYINEIGNIAQPMGADWQNTAVKSSILKKKILFIKKWLDKNWITRFDDIEIINFLITIYEIIDDKNPNALQFRQKIFDVLNCRKNKVCRETNINQLQELVLELINDQNIINTDGTYLIRTDANKYDSVMNTVGRIRSLHNNMNIFKRGPTVNFEIYDYYEKLRENPNNQKVIPDTTISNIDFFLSDVLKVIHRDIRFNPGTEIYPTHLRMLPNTDRETITIYAFVHGSLIRDMWKRFSNCTYRQYEHKLNEMMNTFVVSNIITLGKISNRIINHDFKIIHDPIKIRSSYNNFEKYNINVCKTQSVKGIINYPLGDPTRKLSRERYHPTPDSEFFYCEQLDGQYHDNLPLQIGGYKKKYLKYKQKYLNQKKT